MGGESGDVDLTYRYALDAGYRQGYLVLEDINEHPFRVERMLLQLAYAGILDPPERHYSRQLQRRNAQ
ncbi:Muramoyltetrapeptide carboxypeptidase [Salmonella bongori]|nr:Muramoyltetrapeptide carboxypeptidase [Salmonella bongori]